MVVREHSRSSGKKLGGARGERGGCWRALEGSGMAIYRPGEGSGAHGRAPDRALMAGRGWTRHGHGASGSFKANHDEVATQGDAVEHGRAPGHEWRSRREQWPDRARACTVRDASVITTGTGANATFWPGRPCPVDRSSFP